MNRTHLLVAVIATLTCISPATAQQPPRNPITEGGGPAIIVSPPRATVYVQRFQPPPGWVPLPREDDTDFPASLTKRHENLRLPLGASLTR